VQLEWVPGRAMRPTMLYRQHLVSQQCPSLCGVRTSMSVTQHTCKVVVLYTPSSAEAGSRMVGTARKY
jgi:hypothetical protein